MSRHITWNRSDVPFADGETVAQALMRAGYPRLGTGPPGQRHSVLCGAWQCQNCLVFVTGCGVREACLTLCRDGLTANPVEAASD